MSLTKRVALYKKLEAHRGRPLLVFCTSNRGGGAAGGIAGDVVPEFLEQLQRLPKRAKAVDLLLVSNGGDPTVAWRIVSLIRAQVKELSVLVPQAAFSAATLIALGADEIVMHPHGNLGPTDPQITPGAKADGTAGVPFGSEDLNAFLSYVRETVGITDQNHLIKAFELFSDQVGAVPIGIAARGSQLTVTMGEKLLRMHMVKDGEQQEARAISEKLTKDFFHHGYPLNRSEAKAIGLKIAERDVTTEGLMWKIWTSISQEMELRTPFNAMTQVAKNPECAHLFAPVPTAQNVPDNLDPSAKQQLMQKLIAGVQTVNTPLTPYKLLHAMVESCRYASRFESGGQILAHRRPDLTLQLSQIQTEVSWVTLPIPKAPRRIKKTQKMKKE